MKIGISIGDLNGVGAQIALLAHDEIKKLCEPIYFVDKNAIKEAARLLRVEVHDDFICVEICDEFKIEPSKITAIGGKYSYFSFKKAVEYAREGKIQAVVTLPVHKEAWSLAGVKYKGHTDMLRDFFKKDAIMMLGKTGFFVALFTEHIPYKEVPSKLKYEALYEFLLTLYREKKEQKIAVLGLNPHAGDGGVLGDEEEIIKKAIDFANKTLKKDIFDGPLVPDTAFIKHNREKYRLFVAMYHDQGLIPLKTLFFDESINVSLNLPIIRTSVDHGTAFDIAYSNTIPNTLSFINAVKEAVLLAKK